MTLKEYIEYIKLEVTGGLLNLEITDEQIAKLINSSLIELQRYTDESRLIEVPFSSCIDLAKIEEESDKDEGDWKNLHIRVSSVTNIYRVIPLGDIEKTSGSISSIDSMYAQLWMGFNAGGGSMNLLNNYMLNYMSYNTLLQIRNTASTDMAFKYDHQGKKLYVNTSGSDPRALTIEYVPVYNTVEDVKSDYWIDQLRKMAVAKTKIALGRIRTFAKQTNALYTLDGDTILAEGNEELRTQREKLEQNSDIFYPVD